MGLLDLLLWMLWQQLLWSIYNSQISETLDSKEITLPNPFPCLELQWGGVSGSWNSFLVGELERPLLPAIGHGLRSSSVICQSHALVRGIRPRQANMGGH